MKPIKIKELIAALKECDQEAVVAISVDSEGNNYSCMPNDQFLSNNAYLQNELGGQEELFEKPNAKKKLVKCVVLWPSN